MTEQTYQLLDDLPVEAFEALKNDIRARGVLVPVELTEDGRVLDGHQRLRAVAALAVEGLTVDYPVVVRHLATEEDRFAYAVSINLQRRQLTLGQKRELAERLRRRFRWSNPRLGAVLGVDQSTVHRWLADVEDLPDAVEGEDGRTYRTGGVFAASARRQLPDAQRAAAELGPLDRALDVKRALVLVRQQRLDRPFEEAADADTDLAAAELRVGKVTDALQDLPDASVDLILTDPPYPEEFLDCWWQLAVEAKRLLRPGRLLIAYCGQRWLDQCFNALQSYLDYAWLGGLWFQGRSPSVHDRRVFSGWRPILIFSHGPWEPSGWINDAFIGTGPEKDLHEWQQSVDGFLTLVEQHSTVGELVVDPFLGSGTTAMAALSLGRRFIGCDVDPGAVAVARQRVLRRFTP